jgi:hypothetical protein
MVSKIVSQSMSDFRVRAYLAHRICPGTHEHTKREYHDTRNLQFRIPLSPHNASQHGSHATEAAENDVNGHGDVERKRPVVQHVDAVKQESDVRPPRHGHTTLSTLLAAGSEERRREGGDRDECELQESYQKTCEVMSLLTVKGRMNE